MRGWKTQRSRDTEREREGELKKDRMQDQVEGMVMVVSLPTNWHTVCLHEVLFISKVLDVGAAQCGDGSTVSSHQEGPGFDP